MTDREQRQNRGAFQCLERDGHFSDAMPHRLVGTDGAAKLLTDFHVVHGKSECCTCHTNRLPHCDCGGHVQRGMHSAIRGRPTRQEYRARALKRYFGGR